MRDRRPGAIVAVTMHGPDTFDLWKGAYESAHHLVDGFIGRHPQGPVRDFSYERNTMLEMASNDNYDWALMLDTDERLVFSDGPGHLRRALDNPAMGDVIMVTHVGGTYEKERLFRLPAKGHYRGRTHEAFIMDAGAHRSTIGPGIVAFDEVPKTPEQYRAKVERDLALLQEEVREEPDDPRWWYYLGDTESGLGNASNAMAAFRRCWHLNGWDEESAWAAYRVAEILSTQDRFAGAIEWCCKGMQRHPGMSELPWLAGWCCWRMSRYDHAIWWSKMALALNEAGAHQTRIGFRYPPALKEGPLDVLRWSYRALGRGDEADEAERQFAAALCGP